MKKGDIVLLRCSNKKVIPVLIIGKKADKIVGVKVRGYTEINDTNSKFLKKYNNTQKKQLEEKKKQLEMVSVVIGKPDGLRYNSIVKINREFIVENKNIVAKISELDNKLYAEVLVKYTNYKKKQSLHRELHELKKKIFLCQINNEKYDEYEKMLDEILEELDFPKIHRKSYKPAYNGFREVPTNGYIKVYKGGR